MSNVVFLGIDPGLSGALAVIDGAEVRLFDVPTRKAARGEEFLAGAMADLIREQGWTPAPRSSFCTVEVVSAPRGKDGKPNGNVTSALKIGRGAGLWEGILAGASVPYELVAPATWKAEFRLTGCDKAASRARACELFPVYRAVLLKKRPDFSEALLIGEYGRRRQARG